MTKKNKEVLGTVLIVEDEDMIAKPLIDSCMDANMAIFRAHDGEEGLKMALEEHPDVIVLDILMPKMNGTEMLDRLRTDEWGKTAKVMFVTNIDRERRPEGTDDHYVTDYIVKTDWRLSDVVDRIVQRINESKRA